MEQTSGPAKAPAEQVLKDIRRQTRRHCSAEEKIRIVLEVRHAGARPADPPACIAGLKGFL
jgi:hypothetical protein